MACSVTITSVIGIPMGGGSTTSTVHVSGTLSGDCQPVTSPWSPTTYDIVVVVDCGGAGPISATTLSSGGLWAVDVPATCACTKDITVTAECASNAACKDTFTGVLQCQQAACPTGSISISPGDCNPDGTRNVSFAANITSAPPGTLAGQFDYGDGTWGMGLSFSGTGSHPDPTSPHHYPPPGPPNPVRFVWIIPSNCPPLTTVLSGLQTCPIACPTGNVQVTASPPSDCTPNNTRLVTLQASVTGVTPQNYEWDFPGGTSSQQPIGLGPPPPITVEYPAATASTPVASCTVRIFNGVCSYTGMTTITISPCKGGGGNGGNGGFGLCAGLLVSAITLLLLGAASIIIGVCYSVPPLVIAGGIAVAIGLLLFILWAVFCARFTSCSVMQTVHCILFFMIAVIAPIIVLLAFLFGSLACVVAAAGAWGGWGTIYAWLGSVMGSVGCTKTC
jgi:hypothetical protein